MLGTLALPLLSLGSFAGVRITAAALALQARPDQGLTLREVLANIPHDTAAAVVYVLVGASLGVIWWAHRNAGKEHRGFNRAEDPDSEEPRPPSGGGRPPRSAA